MRHWPTEDTHGNLSPAMARPRCDPIPFEAVRGSLNAGQSMSAVYRDYASNAAIPYAAKTFYRLVLAHLKTAPRAGGLDKSQGADINLQPEFTGSKNAEKIPQGLISSIENSSEAYWARFINPKPHVLATRSANVKLNARGGALDVFDDGERLTFPAEGRKPSAIVLSCWGGSISIAALNWLSRHRVALVLLDWDREPQTIFGGQSQSHAALARSQFRATEHSTIRLIIARAIVDEKLRAYGREGGLRLGQMADAREALLNAPSVEALMVVEAQAARLAWPGALALEWRLAGAVGAWKRPWPGRRGLKPGFLISAEI
jgi:CRISPR associated protein Cas1